MKRPNNDKYSLNNKKTVTVREQNSNNQREKYSPCSFSQPKTNLKLDHDVFQHHIR